LYHNALHDLKFSAQHGAKLLLGGRQRGTLDPKRAAAAGTDNFVGPVIDQLNRVVTVRAADVHSSRSMTTFEECRETEYDTASGGPP